MRVRGAHAGSTPFTCGDNSVLQMSDLLAYLTKQSIEPNTFFSRSRNHSILRMTDDLFGGPCQVISS